MEKFKFLTLDKISRIAGKPGVYCFKKNKEFLYIGKAASLRERVKSHFAKASWRDRLFIDLVQRIGYIETDSEIEALIMEAGLIKKYQPKYNVVWRDDKNYFFVGIAKEKIPWIFITHQPKKETFRKVEYIGPFVEGKTLKETLKVLRKIFPYYIAKKHPPTPCLWCHLGLCPGPDPNEKEYRKNITNLTSFLKGKKQTVLKNLKTDMERAAKNEDFEKAAAIRDRIFSFERVLAHTRIFGPARVFRPEEKKWSDVQKYILGVLGLPQAGSNKISRIEAYDISNIQGEHATGSMVTFIDGKTDKNLYRRFKIKISGKPDDVAMIKEVLGRRFAHTEWGFPDLVLIDGGKAQLNAARHVIGGLRRLKIPVISLAKRKNELYTENEPGPLLLKKLPREIFNLILQLRDEAHRFAIGYHRKLRLKAFLF